MTPTQARKLYWPAWSRALKAAWYRHPVAGYVIQSAESMAVEITVAAQEQASAEFRAMDADDLRHAAHRLALGRDKSSSQLTNRELDRIVALFRILADPEDLRARLEYDNPQRGERRRQDYVIRTSVPEAYARHVAADKFGTANLDGLNDQQARELAMTLRCRAAAQQPL